MNTKSRPGFPIPIIIAAAGFFIVLVIVVVLFISTKSGVKTDLTNEGKEKMTFEDKKTGEKVELATGQLPANFPNNFPIYPQAKIDSSMTGDKDGRSGGFWLNLTTTDSISKAADFYKNNLKAKGWNISDIAQEPENYVINLTGGKFEGTVSINRDSENKETEIHIILGETSQESSDSSEDTSE